MANVLNKKRIEMLCKIFIELEMKLTGVKTLASTIAIKVLATLDCLNSVILKSLTSIPNHNLDYIKALLRLLFCFRHFLPYFVMAFLLDWLRQSLLHLL